MPMPLVELHCHIEGATPPALARKLAARHGIDLGAVIGEDGRYRWSDFGEFLACYDAMSEAIRTAEDYADITREYFTNLASKGLIYAELFISPEHAARVGIGYPDLLDAIAAVIAEVEQSHGVTGRLIVTCVRHYGVAHAEKMAELAARHPHPLVTGFGIAGDEAFGDHADFARAFAIARDAGLGLTAHAGEVLGPESIRLALRHLKVSRIGHGVRAGEDPELLDELRDRGIALELCPSSNIALGLYPDIAAHPVRRYQDAGLNVSLSADDPPFFDTDVAREYQLVAAAHHLAPSRMLAFSRNAINAAFCDRELKAKLLARVDAWERAAQAML